MISIYKISDNAKDLVRGLDRLSVDEALEHSFVKKVADDEVIPPPSAKRARLH